MSSNLTGSAKVWVLYDQWLGYDMHLELAGIFSTEENAQEAERALLQDRRYTELGTDHISFVLEEIEIDKVINIKGG